MILIILLAITVCCARATFGCVGARPLAMGGAFIGLADDANATYWNPAGLIQMPAGAGQVTWMHTSSNRDEINYQDFGAMGMRFDGNGLAPNFAFGASYVDQKTLMSLGNNNVIDDEKWYWASFAYDTSKYGVLGLNIKQIDDKAVGYHLDTDFSFDLSYLYKVSDKISLGALVQDVNEPKTTSAGFSPITHIRNWRGGIAYHPASNLVLTLDGYDLTNDAGDQSARVGGEYIYNNYAIRAGYLGIGAHSSNGFTFGLGVKKGSTAIDAVMLMGDFDNTIMLSANFTMR